MYIYIYIYIYMVKDSCSQYCVVEIVAWVWGWANDYWVLGPFGYLDPFGLKGLLTQTSLLKPRKQGHACAKRS